MAKTLPKSERLSSRKAIQALFTSGNRFTEYPISVSYVISKEGKNFWDKVGVSVSKRKFASAVKRNRIKRMMREAYRLNKTDLVDFCEKEQMEVHVFFVYLEKTEVPYQLLQDKISKLLIRLQRQLKNENSKA